MPVGTAALPALAATVWRAALALALAAVGLAIAAATATATRDGAIDALVLALAVVPLGVVVHLLTTLAILAERGIFLDVNEDVLGAIVGRHEAEALVSEEFLNHTRGRHV